MESYEHTNGKRKGLKLSEHEDFIDLLLDEYSNAESHQKAGIRVAVEAILRVNKELKDKYSSDAKYYSKLKIIYEKS